MTGTGMKRRSAEPYAAGTVLRKHTVGRAPRRLTGAGALIAVAALIAVSSSVSAAPTKVSTGHTLCQKAYCSVFGPGAPASHGAPGSLGLFTIFCPVIQEVTTPGGFGEAPLVQEFPFAHTGPVVVTWPGGKDVPLSDYSQGIYGGDLAFESFAFTVPAKKAGTLILNGGGWCFFESDEDPTKIGYSDAVEWDYFWIDDPPTYWNFSSALLAALAGQFGSMQLIIDEGFGAAGFGTRESPVSPGPVVGPTPPPPPPTTTTGGQRPTVTTTTSTTLGPTTTTTRRGAS